LKAGFFVFIQNPLNKWYKVLNPEPFNYRTGDGTTAEYATVAAGANSGFVNIENLEPDKSPPHLFYVVPGVEDTEVRYFIKIPAGTNRLGTDVIQDAGFIDAFRSPYFNPNPQYAFWIVADFFPAIQANNNSNVTRTPRIWFEGYKYDIQELDPKKEADAALIGRLSTGQIPSARVHIGGVNTSSGVN
jgi:hypothetical protein